MIKANFNAYNSYVTDSLFQWERNQKLEISGLNLAVAPEIHFSNAEMDRAIVRQSVLMKGNVMVDIPNSMLQSGFDINVYIGIYEGETFKVIETICIPIKPRKKPEDYILEVDDHEVYSFKALENKLNNLIVHNGDTGSNSELLDIRVGSDGKMYPTAGESVRGQYELLDQKIEELNRGGLEMKDDVIGKNVTDWLNDNPEATSTVMDGSLTESKIQGDFLKKIKKDYVTPQMMGYEKGMDIGIYIQKVLDNYDVCFVPAGEYDLYNTIILQGGYYSGKPGKVLIFDNASKITLRRNVNAIEIKYFNNVIKGGLFYINSEILNYNSSIIYMHSTSNVDCICDNNISDIKILSYGTKRETVGIKMLSENTGYCYANKFDNIKLENLKYGVYIDAKSINGINANNFTNFTWWACKQCAHIYGNGNTFKGIGQGDKRYDESTACFEIYGSSNLFDVFIYDVGNENVIKYLYQLKDDAERNVFLYQYDPKITIENDKMQIFPNDNYYDGFKPVPNNTLINIPICSDYVMNDKRQYGSKMWSINMSDVYDVRFKNILAVDNIVSNATIHYENCEKYGGIDTSNLGEMTSFFSDADKYIGIKGERGVEFGFTITYTFNTTKYKNLGLKIDELMLGFINGYNSLGKFHSKIIISEKLQNGEIIEFEELTKLTDNTQTALYRVFRARDMLLPSINDSIESLSIKVIIDKTNNGMDNSEYPRIGVIHARGVNRAGIMY